MNPSKKITQVVGVQGNTFNVRLVQKGDAQGHQMQLTYNDDQPMVEFYDASSKFEYDFVGHPEAAEAAGAFCLGQFVTRYYVSTLLKDIEFVHALKLHGGIPRWTVCGKSLRRAFVQLGLWSNTGTRSTLECQTKAIRLYHEAVSESENTACREKLVAEFGQACVDAVFAYALREIPPQTENDTLSAFTRKQDAVLRELAGDGPPHYGADVERAMNMRMTINDAVRPPSNALIAEIRRLTGVDEDLPEQPAP